MLSLWSVISLYLPRSTRMLWDALPATGAWTATSRWSMSKLRFTMHADSPATKARPSARRGARRRFIVLTPRVLQLATEPAARASFWTAGATAGTLVTRGSGERPQNSNDAPHLEVKVVSGRQGAPGNARTLTRTSSEAISVFTQ